MKKTAIIIIALFIIGGTPDLHHLQVTSADRESEFPCLAWTGTEFGVAWMDGREGNQEIYFRSAEVGTKGLGPETRLTHSGTWDVHPNLCWTGSEFGLSWIHETNYGFDLFFMKISAAGAPAGKTSTIIKKGSLGKDTAIMSTGNGFGVITTEFGGESQGNLTFRYLDAEGNSQGPPARLTMGAGTKVVGSLIKAGSDFGVFYLNASDDSVWFLAIDALGNPKGSPSRLSLEGVSAGVPAAAFNGKSYAAVWPQKIENGQQVMAASVGTRGEVLRDPAPLTTPGADRPSVAAAAGPNGFGAAWIEVNAAGRTLYFRSMDGTAKANAPVTRVSQPRPSAIIDNEISMSADGTGYVIGWSDVAREGNTEIILSRVSF